MVFHEKEEGVSFYYHDNNLLFDAKFLIAYMKEQLRYDFSGLTLNIMPFSIRPASFPKTMTAFVFANDSQCLIYQLSHELVHIYLQAVPLKIHWLNELLASYASYYPYPNADYAKYLPLVEVGHNNHISIDNVATKIKNNLSKYERDRELVYLGNDLDISLSYKNIENFDCFSFIREFKDCLADTRYDTDTIQFKSLLRRKYPQSKLLPLLSQLE